MQFKRLLLLTMAACFTLAGCSETKENSTNDSSSQTEIAEQLDTTQPADDDPLTAQVKVEKLDLGVTDVGMSEFFHTENGYGMFVFPQKFIFGEILYLAIFLLVSSRQNFLSFSFLHFLCIFSEDDVTFGKVISRPNRFLFLISFKKMLRK